jgi:hypothetical protein
MTSKYIISTGNAYHLVGGEYVNTYNTPTIFGMSHELSDGKSIINSIKII